MRGARAPAPAVARAMRPCSGTRGMRPGGASARRPAGSCAPGLLLLRARASAGRRSRTALRGPTRGRTQLRSPRGPRPRAGCRSPPRAPRAQGPGRCARRRRGPRAREPPPTGRAGATCAPDDDGPPRRVSGARAMAELGSRERAAAHVARRPARRPAAPAPRATVRSRPPPPTARARRRSSPASIVTARRGKRKGSRPAPQSRIGGWARSRRGAAARDDARGGRRRP